MIPEATQKAEPLPGADVPGRDPIDFVLALALRPLGLVLALAVPALLLAFVLALASLLTVQVSPTLGGGLMYACAGVTGLTVGAIVVVSAFTTTLLIASAAVYLVLVCLALPLVLGLIAYHYLRQSVRGRTGATRVSGVEDPWIDGP